MRKFLIPLTAALVLLSSSAWAQQQATKLSRDARGVTFTMCNAETTTGICDAAAGDLYVVTDQYSMFGFYYSGTNAANYCQIWALPGGSTIAADLTSLKTWEVGSTNLSDTDDVQWFSVSAKYIFVSCTITAGSSTVIMAAQEPSTLRGQ